MQVEKLSMKENGKIKKYGKYMQKFPLLHVWEQILNMIYKWREEVYSKRQD